MKNNEYTRQAKDFLKKHNAKMSITFKDIRKNPWNESGYASQLWHNIYRVRIDRNGKTMSFDFTDSANNYQTNNRPTCYDILACLTKYDPGDYEEFCSEFGIDMYDYDFGCSAHDYRNEKSFKIYKSVLKEYNNVLRLFGDCLNELSEIQ